MEYLNLRVAVQQRGSSIRRWADSEKLPVGLVYNAARGERRSKRARQILRKLRAFAYAK
jgi:hypothetical protein